MPRRQKFQIYLDVLRTLHSVVKLGERVTLYRLERGAGLTHNRLKLVLDELRVSGLITRDLRVTERGYAFMADLSRHVIPILEKYGLWREG